MLGNGRVGGGANEVSVESGEFSMTARGTSTFAERSSIMVSPVLIAEASRPDRFPERRTSVPISTRESKIRRITASGNKKRQSARVGDRLPE
jgi:hypothetical protein